MCFFLRPGSVKRELQPLIKAGGGMLCNVQKPGAILLIHPEERPSIPETTVHWYVSTQYIHDCIEKNELLKMEAYRLNPETLQANSAKLNNSKDGSPGFSGGRSAYTPEEDVAILSYVSKHITEIGGNKIWQEMAKNQVTSHSWQSMKSRYKTRLAQKQPAFKETETAQISSSSESSKAQTGESETYDTPETEEAYLQPVGENPEQQPRATLCCEKDGLPQTALAARPEKASPKLGHQSCSKPSQRPLTRQQLELEEGGPYGKKLRSASTTPEKSCKVPSPQPVTKTKTAAHSTPKKAISGAQPPSKRAIGANVAEHIAPLEREPSVSSEKPQPDEAACLRNGVRKAEKRKLGILELATKEFEDESEPESLDAHNQDITAPGQCTSKDPVVGALNPADPTSSASKVQQGTSLTRPASNSSDSAVPEPATKKASMSVLAKKHGATEETSKAHLFIFDSESQEEEDTQSLFHSTHTSSPVDPQTNVNKATALSLTQVQLEEDMRRIRELMSQTNQDLVSVTKALLKTSGDFSAAQELLLNPCSAAGPFWTRSDDQLLLSADPEVRLKLQSKYGDESVAQRVMFLEMEE